MASEQAMKEFEEYVNSPQFEIDQAEEKAFIEEMGFDPEEKDAWFKAECEFLKRQGWVTVGYKCVSKVLNIPELKLEDPDDDEMMGWKLSPHTGKVYKWDDARIIAHEVSNAEEEIAHVKEHCKRGLSTVVNELIEAGDHELHEDYIVITEAIWDQELMDDRPSIKIDDDDNTFYRLHCPPRHTEWHDLNERMKESPYWKKKLNHD